MSGGYLKCFWKVSVCKVFARNVLGDVRGVLECAWKMSGRFWKVSRRCLQALSQDCFSKHFMNPAISMDTKFSWVQNFL